MITEYDTEDYYKKSVITQGTCNRNQGLTMFKLNSFAVIVLTHTKLYGTLKSTYKIKNEFICVGTAQDITEN